MTTKSRPARQGEVVGPCNNVWRFPPCPGQRIYRGEMGSAAHDTRHAIVCSACGMREWEVNRPMTP